MNVISILIGALLVILGHLIAIWRMQWKSVNDRRNDWEKLRRPIYSEALDIIYAIENNRGNLDRFSNEINRLKLWFPAKGSSLSPMGIDVIFGLISGGTIYYIDVSNRDVDAQTRELFKKSLQVAKDYFLNNQDIRWLPEDKEKEKESGQ